MPTDVPNTVGDRVFFRELTDPTNHVLAVTPSDTTAFTQFTRGLYIGGAGDVAVQTASNDTPTFVGVLAGTILPVRVYRVLSTGTTATSILALF